ncbi:hypothetical protein ACFL6U_19050 [Planctomycetota bacterium]
MHEQDLYNQWLKQKQTVEVPDHYADRVMHSVIQVSQQQRPWWDRLFATPLAQAGLVVATCVVFLLRFILLFTVALG